MTNTKQELIAIRDGAPSGAWPVADEVGVLDGEIVYISNSDNGHPFKVYCDCDGHHLWCYGEDDADFLRIRNRRKLDDIENQIKLMEENEALAARVAKLESDKALLIEDRARFPDRPDCIGAMIYAHIKNKDSLVKSSKEHTKSYRLKLDCAELKITELERERDVLALEFERALDVARECAECGSIPLAVQTLSTFIEETNFEQSQMLLAKRDLEQQAKGVEDYRLFCDKGGLSDFIGKTHRATTDFIKQLRNKAGDS